MPVATLEVKASTKFTFKMVGSSLICYRYDDAWFDFSNGPGFAAVHALFHKCLELESELDCLGEQLEATRELAERENREHAETVDKLADKAWDLTP